MEIVRDSLFSEFLAGYLLACIVSGVIMLLFGSMLSPHFIGLGLVGAGGVVAIIGSVEKR
jgi:hypothetical protein